MGRVLEATRVLARTRTPSSQVTPPMITAVGGSLTGWTVTVTLDWASAAPMHCPSPTRMPYTKEVVPVQWAHGSKANELSVRQSVTVPARLS